MTAPGAMTRPFLRLSKPVAWSAALILLLLLLAFKAGKEGLSNFYVQSARQEVERWSKPGQRLRGDEGARVMQYLAQSLRYAPHNPWTLEELGTIQLRTIATATDPKLAVAAARSANVDFRMVLVERPTSPFAWANLALSKLYLNERDAELIQALQHAAELGPWEPGVQQTVIFVGFAVWNQLNPAQQAMVTLAMQRGARRDPGKIAAIAKSFDRIELFCAINSHVSQGREVCRQIKKSRR